MTASPLPWQPEPIARIADNLRSGRSCLDCSDPGIGKTFIAAFAARTVGASLGIVCPKSVIPAWNEALAAVGVKSIFTHNIEQLKTGKYPWLQRSLGDNWKWRMPDDGVLVFDEAHGFAGSETENGIILACAPRPSLMLSATMADSPMRMRAVAHQLGICKWGDFHSWAGKHGCVRDRFKGWKFRGTENDMLKLHSAIFDAGHGVRVRIRDLGNLFPENRVRTIEVPVEDPEQIQDEYAVAIRMLRDNSPSAEGYLTRCRQLAEYAKIPALVELAKCDVAEGRAVAIFVNYKDTVRRIAELLKCPKIDGDTSPEDREKNRKAFQANEVLEIVATNDVGAQSISMHDIRGRHPVSTKICPGFSARMLIQALGRCHRAGGKSPVDQTLVFAQGVESDSIVRSNVEKKKGCIETLNDGDLTDRPPER